MDLSTVRASFILLQKLSYRLEKIREPTLNKWKFETSLENQNELLESVQEGYPQLWRGGT